MVLAFARSPEGEPCQLKQPKGAQIVDELDQWARILNRQVITQHEQRIEESEWIGRNRRGNFRLYHWDPMDQLVEETAPDGTTTYDYEARQFLKSKEVVGLGGTRTREEFRPDAMGRPYESRDDGGPARLNATGGLLERRGNVNCEYDHRHRMIRKREDLENGVERLWRFEWDSWDILSATETPTGLRAEYLYDAFARRMQEKVFRREVEG